jgi:hypothetical protein
MVVVLRVMAQMMVEVVLTEIIMVVEGDDGDGGCGISSDGDG